MPSIATVTDEMDFDARMAFGFGEAGYITLYRGHNVEEWAENDRTGIWYNLTFLYYSPSKQKPTQDLNGIEAIQLKWEMVAAEGCKMKPHDEVKRIIMGMTKIESGSAYQGEVDAWLEKEVTVRAKKSKDSRFGTKHTYTLVDAEDNTYIWETGAKDYPCDKVVSLKMKVKEHKEVDGEKVTVVWYCKEV